jgi:hypothetical protein
MAAIIQSYKVAYAPYAAEVPTTGFIELKDCIKSLPNFFPDPDDVDTSVVTNKGATSIPGIEKAAAFDFKVLVDLDFLTAHTSMVSDQSDSAKGYFWMQITLTNRKQVITFPATTVTYLPSPEGELGAVDSITWKVYKYADAEITALT